MPDNGLIQIASHKDDKGKHQRGGIIAGNNGCFEQIRDIGKHGYQPESDNIMKLLYIIKTIDNRQEVHNITIAFMHMRQEVNADSGSKKGD